MVTVNLEILRLASIIILLTQHYTLPSSLSDHYFAHAIYEETISQALKLSMYRNHNNLFKSDNMAKYHFFLMQELETIDWDFIRLEDGREEFVKTIKRDSDVYAPLKAIRSKCKVLIDNKMKREISQRDKLFKIYTFDLSNEVMRSLFLNQRNATKLPIRDETKEYIWRIFNSFHDIWRNFDAFHDIKHFHRYVNSRRVKMKILSSGNLKMRLTLIFPEISLQILAQNCRQRSKNRQFCEKNGRYNQCFWNQWLKAKWMESRTLRRARHLRELTTSQVN